MVGPKEDASLAADEIRAAVLVAEEESGFGGVGGCEAAEARRENRPLRGLDGGLAAAAVAVVGVVLVVGEETVLVRLGGAGAGGGDAAATAGEAGKAADCGVAASGFVADLARPFALAREAAVRGLVKSARHRGDTL